MRWLLMVLVAFSLTACNAVDDLFKDSDNGSDDKGLPVIPPRDDCTRHFGECLGTRLQSNPGGSAGSSRCKDCLDFCRGTDGWPDELEDGKDCRWWNHR